MIQPPVGHLDKFEPPESSVLPLKVKSPFKNSQEKFLTAVEQIWNATQELPTCEKLIELRVVENQGQYNKLINDKFVIRALRELGVKLDNIEILTPKQMAAVQVIFDYTDGRSDSRKLRELGINGQTWQNWLNDPIFQRYLQNKVDNLFSTNLHEVDRALFNKARSGDLPAIRLVYAIAGKRTDALEDTKEEVQAPKIGPIDANIFLMKLYEILHNNLHNQPDLLATIGREIAEIDSPYKQHPKVIEALEVVTSGLLPNNKELEPVRLIEGP